MSAWCTRINFVSSRPGPWCMIMADAKSPVAFGHDHIGSQLNATMEAVECLHSRPLLDPCTNGCVVRYKSAPIRNVVN